MERSRSTRNLNKGHHWVDFSEKVKEIYQPRFPTLRYETMEGLTLGTHHIVPQSDFIYSIATTLNERRDPGAYVAGEPLIALTRGYGITESIPKVPVVIFGKHEGAKDDTYFEAMQHLNVEFFAKKMPIPIYDIDAPRVTLQ